MNTLYQSQHIRVSEIIDTDGDTQRQLSFGPAFSSCQGAIKTSRPLYQLHEFTRHLTYAAFTPAIPLKKVLFLGLGAGIAIHAISNIFPNVLVDVVDSNRELFDISHRYFFPLDKTTYNLISGDASAFVEHSTSSYDLIGCDIWGPSLETPAFLTNTTFYESARARLREGGSFAINAPAHEHKRISEILTHHFLTTLSLKGNNAFLISSDQERLEPRRVPDTNVLSAYNINVDTISEAAIVLRANVPRHLS